MLGGTQREKLAMGLRPLDYGDRAIGTPKKSLTAGWWNQRGGYSIRLEFVPQMRALCAGRGGAVTNQAVYAANRATSQA